MNINEQNTLQEIFADSRTFNNIRIEDESNSNIQSNFTTTNRKST